MATESEAISSLQGEVIIVDTSTSYLYLGTLSKWDEHFLVLTDVDVRDISEGASTKEMYAVEARRHGVQKNRRKVMVRKAIVTSLSRLEDVVLF